MKKTILKLIAMLVGVSLIEIPCWGIESITLQDMLGAHMDRVMRKSGLLFPTRYGEPFTNWFGRVVMEGEDALPFGYNYIQLRDSDGWAEVRDEDGVLTREVAPLHVDAAFVLGDLFGFVPSEDTPPELRLSHLVSKWLVCHSEEEADAIDLTDDELRELASARARRVPRLASAPLVVTNLMVTAIKAESDRVTFVTEWPSSMTFPNDRLDLYTSVDLRGAWSLHGSYDVAGVNAITTTVMKTSIAGYLESQRAQHDDDCYVITNIVASAFEPNVTYTNRQWNCEHKARSETPGFFRWADQTDSDGDGIANAAEKWVYGTEPDNPDSDGDGMSDGQEIIIGTNPSQGDSDGDGVSDIDEINNGTSPTVPESQGGDSESSGASTVIPNFPSGASVTMPFESADEGFETFGNFRVDVTYSDLDKTTSDFSILGISPPGGSATVEDIQYSCDGPYYTNAFTMTASGKSFIPMKTGWYSFQVSADDDANINIGDRVTAISHWSNLVPGPVVSNVFVAGRSYSISATSSSVGGPASLRFDKWGEYTSINNPVMAAEFSDNIIIFEDRYEDSPGNFIPRRSTEARLMVSVYGGSLGGYVSVEGGDVAFSENSVQSVASEEHKVLCFDCKGAHGSSSLGGSSVTIRFVENETGRTMSTEARILVVSCDLICLRSAPANNRLHRRSCGLGERVLVSWKPRDAPIRVNVDGGKFIGSAGIGELEWDVFNGGHSATISLGACTYSPGFSVLPPSGVEGLNPQRMINTNLSAGVAGGALLRQSFRILPLTVSFSRLQIEEVPCNEEIPPEGYFDSISDTRIQRTHTRLAGAGRWVRVDNDNVMSGIDSAGCWDSLPEIGIGGWAGGGTLVWNVPFGWKSCENADEYAEPVGGFAEDVRQTFTLSFNGDFRVYKLGHMAGRTIQGESIND